MTVRDNFDSLVLKILEGRPATAETISVILGLPTNYVLMMFRRMERHGTIESVTKRKMILWGLPRVSTRRRCRKGRKS